MSKRSHKHGTKVPNPTENFSVIVHTSKTNQLTIGRPGDGRPRGRLQDGHVGIVAGGRGGGDGGRSGGLGHGVGVGPEGGVVVHLVDDGGLDDGLLLGSFAAGHGCGLVGYLCKLDLNEGIYRARLAVVLDDALID